MGYTLEAVIASVSLLRAAASVQPPALVVELPQDLAMMPMTDELFDAVSIPTSDRSLGFWKSPGGFDRVLADWSSTGPVSYVEAEFFGGVGRQRAALWENGDLTVGPVSIEVGQPIVATGSPISRILRELGVDRAGYRDEFEAVGLMRHRNTADWMP